MKQIAVVIILLATIVLGQPTIKIGYPPELANLYPNGIDERPAMFGVPSYATSISGRLIWATVNDRDSCSTFNNTGWPTNVPLILVIDRGVCSFVSKVRLAQERGAVAAIIVDDRDEAGLPYMADDGTGGNIAIPSALIHKTDGAALKLRLNPGGSIVAGTGMVTATMTWSLPRPDNRVEYDLWSNSVDELARSWKNNWLRVSQALGEHAKFTPRQWVIDGRGFGCTDASLPCRNQCVMSGRYCAVDPEHDLQAGVSGADVVRENLHQICLANYLNATNYYDTYSFFLYQKCFQTNCYPIPPASGPGTADFNVECTKRCLSTINVTWSVIDTCVQQSGGYADVSNQSNTLLEAEMNLRAAMGIFYLPTLLVNLTPYRGSLVCPTPVDISHCGPLNMICQGYQEGTKPDACNSSPGCWPGELRDGCGVCGGTNSSCADCLGEPYGLASIDSLGTCCKQISRDVCNICFGKGYDSCGLCPGAPSYNKSNCCPDGSMRDVCGTCGGTETIVSNCPGSTTSIGVGGIIGISLGCVAIAAAGVFFYMRRQQNALKNDIDSLLKQYLPLDAANSLAHPSRDQTDGANLIPESAQGPSDL